MIPLDMLKEANREHGTRGRVRPADPSVHRVAIWCDGQVAGFYCPHFAKNGRLRLGPLYIAPAYRRRGLALWVYDGYAGTPMLAAVEDGNLASMRLHNRARFTKSHRYSAGWYYVRD